MNILEAKSDKIEKTQKLSETKSGDVVRFAEITFDEAMSEKAFYMRYANPGVKEGRIALISLDGSSCMERDGDRLVVIHQTTIAISRD